MWYGPGGAKGTTTAGIAQQSVPAAPKATMDPHPAFTLPPDYRVI